MLFILEIVLTIVAWKRGWKGWALVPIAFAVVIGFVIGAVIRAQGGSLEDVIPLTLVIDGACIVSLIALTARGRQKVHIYSKKPAAPVMGTPTVEPTLKATEGYGSGR